MGKTPRCTSYDNDILFWLIQNHGDNVSEGVNKILRKEMENSKNPISIIAKSNKIIEEQTLLKSEAMKQILHMKREGTRSERVEAEQAIQREKIKEKEHRQHLRDKVKLMRDSEQWEQFIKEANNGMKGDFYEDWTNKFQEDDIPLDAFDLLRIINHRLIKEVRVR